MLKPSYVLLLSVIVTTRAKMEGFIVGGSYANIEHHAHSAFLNVHCVSDDGNRTAWICGSSVVNHMLILTAGHCLYGCNIDSHMAIHLGNEHRNRGKVYSVVSFMLHENYCPVTSSNDICLLKIDSTLTLNKKISRVALMKNPPYTELAKVAGWGMVDEVRARQSDWLKYVTQKVIRRSDCLRLFGFLPKGTICASPADYSKGYAAQGDSGSALIVRGYIQIGLVSYKVPEIKGNIVVYTDIGFFYDWIKTNSKRLFCTPTLT